MGNRFVPVSKCIFQQFSLCLHSTTQIELLTFEALNQMKILIDLHLSRIILFPELHRFKAHRHFPDFLGLLTIPCALLLSLVFRKVALIAEKTHMSFPFFSDIFRDVLVVFCQLLFLFGKNEVFSALLVDNLV